MCEWCSSLRTAPFFGGFICADLQGGGTERMRGRVGGGGGIAGAAKERRPTAASPPSIPQPCLPLLRQTATHYLATTRERWRHNHRHADCRRFRLERQKYPSAAGGCPQIQCLSCDSGGGGGGLSPPSLPCHAFLSSDRQAGMPGMRARRRRLLPPSSPF